jgi:hypothetical protein
VEVDEAPSNRRRASTMRSWGRTGLLVRVRVCVHCAPRVPSATQIGSCPAHHLVTQTKRGVSLNFPDQVTSERRFGAMLQSNCPYARCSTSELMTWQKKSRGLQSTLRKTENIAPVRANRERLLCSLFAHSSTLGEVSFFLEESRRHSSTSPMTCSSAVARAHVGRLASRASVADRRVASRAASRRSAACSPCVASAVPKVIYACPLVHQHSDSPLLLSARSTVFMYPRA